MCFELAQFDWKRVAIFDSVYYASACLKCVWKPAFFSLYIVFFSTLTDNKLSVYSERYINFT
jgi:hypothetical protein